MTIDVEVDVHFPDIKTNSYGINNIKFYLNASVKVRFIANDQGL